MRRQLFHGVDGCGRYVKAVANFDPFCRCFGGRYFVQSGVQTLNVGIASDAVGHAQFFAQRFFSSISKKTFPVVVGVGQHGNVAISGGAGLPAA